MTEIVNEGRQAKPSTRATYREVFIQLREGPRDSESNGIGVCVCIHVIIIEGCPSGLLSNLFDPSCRENVNC